LSKPATSVLRPETGDDKETTVRVRSKLSATALAVAMVLGSAQPAYAGELATGCNSGRLGRLDAWAYYTPGVWNEWYEFKYQFTSEYLGNRNNLGIALYRTHRIVWSYQSPDSLRPDVLYTTNPPSPIAIVSRNEEWVVFHATFDIGFQPDPDCEARTQTV
jgi:hypothetical protein